MENGQEAQRCKKGSVRCERKRTEVLAAPTRSLREEHGGLGGCVALTEPLDTYTAPIGCPHCWAGVLQVWASQIFT